MKRIFFIVSLLCFSFLFAEVEVQQRLSLLYSPKVLKQIILPVEDWHPFPNYNERDEWQKFPDKIRHNIVRRGEDALKKEWFHLPAAVYLDFARNGNRSRYQDLEFSRRYILLDLVMAELLEGEGRFLDAIVNGIWSICEQSTWTLPAHITPGLPDVQDPTVALFSAETGAMLSWIYYLFHDAFDEVSPKINDRILYEIDKRVLTPCHKRDDFWWMGFNEGSINNWNPWCNSNWLTCILLAEKDSSQKYLDLHKCLKSLDRYLDTRLPDGGCDEGPSYWNHAAGTMFIALELLNGVTNRRLNIFGDPLIRNLGHYIADVHIYNDYFVNFADASAKVRIDGYLIYRYGEAVQDNDLRALGIQSIQEGNSTSYKSGYNLYRRLQALFQNDILTIQNTSSKLSIDSYLPDTQVMTARSNPRKNKGLFLAAKGGHNNESHNHNDVGNFIIYKEGQPFIIDVGVETYTRKTFSKDRYTIWTMNSNYHSLPTINGIVQKNGAEFKAKNVRFKANKKQVTFSLDIANAYPVEAGIESWKRHILFKRDEFIELTESYRLQKMVSPVVLHLMSLNEPILRENGRYLITSKVGTILELEFPDETFDIRIEKIELTDPQLKRVWGTHLYCIHLTSQSEKLVDSYQIKFR